jgi:hypothetical protein
LSAVTNVLRTPACVVTEVADLVASVDHLIAHHRAASSAHVRVQHVRHGGTEQRPSRER